MTTVSLPDGSEVEFPDDMSTDAIRSALIPGTPGGNRVGSMRDPKTMKTYQETGKPYLQAFENFIGTALPGQGRSVGNTDNLLSQVSQPTDRKYRGYTNPQSLNQYDGVPEAFAHGVYQAPGDSARMLEGLADYTSLGMASNLFSPSFAEQATLSKYVDNATGVNEMNYDPNNYDGIGSLTNAASLAGSIVGAPENALPIGMVAGQTAKRLGSAVGNDLMRPSMVNQSGMVGSKGAAGDKSSRMQRMEDNGLERGWYRGGKEPADAPWYSQDRDYAKRFARGDFREYALPVDKQGMNTAIPNDILAKVADSAADNGDLSIAKEIRSAISDGEPLSYSELNMWFDNNGSTGVNQHFKQAGVEMVSDGKTAYMVNANRVRDAKKATFDPDKKMMKGINLSLGGLLGVNYLNDKEPQNPDL